MVQSNHTWEASVVKCQLLGGHLATVDNQVEFDLLYDMLQASWADSRQPRALWVDGTDVMSQGEWYCVTMGRECYWKRLSSSDADGPQRCMCVWHEAGFADGLGRCTCEYDDFRFPVCEFRPPRGI